MIWIDDLAKEHGRQYINNFLEWLEERRDPLSIQLNEVSNEQFASCLKSVDWIQRNDALGTVNARLCSRYISADPDLFLGHCKGTPLTVRLNGRLLNPPDSDWRYYGVSSVNPPTLLGLRYKPLNEKLKPQDFLFVTLGRLICALLKVKCVCEQWLMPPGNIYSLQQSESGGWNDTGFVLLLSVNSSGGGDGLYICYKSVDPDHDGEFGSGGGKDLIPTFPGIPSPFTLAKGSSAHVDLELLQSPLQSEPIIDVVAVSNSKLEVAETGMKGDWSPDNPPIPLFAVDKEEQPSRSGV